MAVKMSVQFVLDILGGEAGDRLETLLGHGDLDDDVVGDLGEMPAFLDHAVGVVGDDLGAHRPVGDAADPPEDVVVRCDRPPSNRGWGSWSRRQGRPRGYPPDLVHVGRVDEELHGLGAPFISDARGRCWTRAGPWQFGDDAARPASSSTEPDRPPARRPPTGSRSPSRPPMTPICSVAAPLLTAGNSLGRHARRHERAEERVRPIGPALELRVELGGDKPRVIPQLDDLDQAAVRDCPDMSMPASSSRSRYALFTSNRWRWRSKMISSPVRGSRLRSRRQPGRILAEPHRAAFLLHVPLVGHEVDDGVLGEQVELGGVGVGRAKQWRANSITAHWRPRQSPRNGSPLSRARWTASTLPSIPRCPKPPGTRIPATPARRSPRFPAWSSSESTQRMRTVRPFAQPACRSASETER